MGEVTMERFDVNEQPRAGRPLVARFRGERKTALDLRVEREHGALWLFATGPAGGARGGVVVHPKRAALVLAFVNDETNTISGGEAYLTARAPFTPKGEPPRDDGTKIVAVRKGMSMNGWSMRFDPDTFDELRDCLRDWATSAMIATVEPPKPGELFARGPWPFGTPEQVAAWLMAGPEGNLVRILRVTHDGLVRYVHVSRHGHHGGELRAPLATFYGDGWSRIGNSADA